MKEKDPVPGAATGSADDPKGAAAAAGASDSRSMAVYVLLVLGLLYVFLLSINLMGDAFKMFGKGFAEALIRNCSNPIVGLFIGVFATSIIQSSSTSTSLTVGFVVGGVLPLNFAIPIIMGANVGTTITNILVSFGFVARKEDFRRAFAGATVHDFFNLCSVAVLFPIEVKFHLIERLAIAMTGLFSSAGGATVSGPLRAIIKPVASAVKHLFTDTFGMSPTWAGALILVCSVAMLITSLIFLVKVLRRVIVQKAERFINRYLFRNDLTALALGVGITAAAQSSSVTTSLIVPLVGAGIVSLRRCYPYTLGANIGTTVTALLAALSTVTPGVNGAIGVTTAFAHLLFNVLGIAIFYPLRRIPIFLAERLADVAAESKRWAILFTLGVFFCVPLLIILVAHWLQS